MQEAPWAAAVRSSRSAVLSAFDAGEGRVLALLSEHRKDHSRWAKSRIDGTVKKVGRILAEMESSIIAGLESGAENAAKSVGGTAPDLSADIQRVKSQVSRMGAEIRERLTAEARQISQAAAVQKISKSASAEKLTGSHLSNGVQTTFGDRNGKKWKSRTYFSVLAEASAANSGLSVFSEKTTDHGHDLVVVSGPRSGCPKCRPWIGKTLSISGTDKTHKSVDEAKAAGLFHPRCKHFLKIKKEEKEGE